MPLELKSTKVSALEQQKHEQKRLRNWNRFMKSSAPFCRFVTQSSKERMKLKFVFLTVLLLNWMTEFFGQLSKPINF